MSIVSLNCLAALVVATIATPALAGAPTSISAPTFQTGDSWVYDRANEKGTSGFSRQRLDLTILGQQVHRRALQQRHKEAGNGGVERQRRVDRGAGLAACGIERACPAEVVG